MNTDIQAMRELENHYGWSPDGARYRAKLVLERMCERDRDVFEKIRYELVSAEEQESMNSPYPLVRIKATNTHEQRMTEVVCATTYLEAPVPNDVFADILEELLHRQAS